MNLSVRKVFILLIIIVLVLSMAACNKTAYVDSENIIEPSEIKEELKKDDVIVIDARSVEDYNKGHLKGAISLVPTILSDNDPVPGVLADKTLIQEVLSSKGISAESKIYIYDNNGGVFAGRLWWILKAYGHETVKVINRGQRGLEVNGLEMSLEVPSLPKTDYKLNEFDTSMIAYIEEVSEVATDEESDVILLDVRSRQEYDEGAIPGAILYQHTKNLYADGTFKSARDIYIEYNDLGIERDDEIILYCKTSFRATQTALLLDEAGFENVKVYDGAYVEWVHEGNELEESEDIVVVEQDAS